MKNETTTLALKKCIEDYLHFHFDNLTERMIHNHPPLIGYTDVLGCPYCKIHGNILDTKKTTGTSNCTPLYTIDDM